MCQFPPFDTFIVSVPFLHPIVLRFIISAVSHYEQVPINFVFHYIFSVPLCASSPSFYIPLYLQCPILGKFPYLFTFHYIFSVPFWASSLSIYISLDLQCPIWGKFSIYLHFIISLVSHYGQVPYLFTFHQIFSVPFGASSLSIYIPLDLQCPIMCKFSIFLHSIISSVSHYVQVPYSFTFHYIFSVPLCASSLSFYISLYLQCPILMCQFPPFDTFHIVSVSGKVPLVLSYLQCPIVGKYPIILCFIIYLVSHYVQVPYLFTFHYIFSVPFGASSLSIYIPLDLQCPIMCMFPIFLPFIISLVSHYVQVP